MSSPLLTRRNVLASALVLFAASQFAVYYGYHWYMNRDPSEKEVQKRRGEVLIKLKKKGIRLDEYEQLMARELIHPDNIRTGFDDVGGLEDIIVSLRESIIYPLTYPDLFTATSSLLRAPKGVLLYGPPGCGKTMLARALAKESGATFINISASSLTNKWFGESNKLVVGLFGLARKMQPTIIFVDEIDTFLRERRVDDHEAMSMLKAEFMTSWDGLTSGSDQILVVGATNRPQDIDPAILRRMPKRFAIGLPNVEQRFKILSLMLKDTKLAPTLPLDILATKTTGFSGSDLHELCRSAAMIPLRERMREISHDGEEPIRQLKKDGFTMRPLTLDDFYNADSRLIPLDADPDGDLLLPDAGAETSPEDRQRLDEEDDNLVDAPEDISNGEGVDSES